jgi:hypothetical protein
MTRWSGSLLTNGDDKYFFDIGYGHDTIIDHDRSAGNTDTIELADGINPDDIRLSQSGDDLTLSINGTNDTLTVENWFWNDSPEYRVEQIEFSDDTAWDVDAIKERVLRATDGDDVLIGTAVSDTLYAYGGNDRVFGRGSEDVLDGESGGNTYKKRAAGLLPNHRTLCCGRLSQPRADLQRPRSSHKPAKKLGIHDGSRKSKYCLILVNGAGTFIPSTLASDSIFCQTHQLPYSERRGAVVYSPRQWNLRPRRCNEGESSEIITSHSLSIYNGPHKLDRGLRLRSLPWRCRTPGG